MPKVLFGSALSCSTVTKLLGMPIGVQDGGLAEGPSRSAPVGASFGHAVPCFTTHVLGTAISIPPNVAVFHPGGIETDVVVLVAVEPLQAAMSNGRTARVGRNPLARRRLLRSSSVT